MRNDRGDVPSKGAWDESRATGAAGTNGEFVGRSWHCITFALDRDAHTSKPKNKRPETDNQAHKQIVSSPQSALNKHMTKQTKQETHKHAFKPPPFKTTNQRKSPSVWLNTGDLRTVQRARCAHRRSCFGRDGDDSKYMCAGCMQEKGWPSFTRHDSRNGWPPAT